MANRKRKPINLDSNREGEKFDTLFSSQESPVKKVLPEQEEVRLQQFDKIRNFFKKDKRQKTKAILNLFTRKHSKND